MLFVLSPAKALDYETPLPPGLPHTQPLFVPQAAALIEVLRRQSPQQIASLMSISDALAGLNVARYQAWQPTFTAANARQAVLAFNGDVYEGLQAASLSLPQLDWLQARLCILSGLYGVLRPLDWMQPYRLEMGTRLATDRGDNLYQFWDGRITDYLNQRLAEQGRAHGGDAQPAVLVNLASQEYFKAVQRKRLQARVIDCVFEDYKNGQYKIISFNAKRARGLMVRFCAQQGIDRPEGLQAFDLDGYAFAPAASEPERLVFRRRR